MFAEALRIGQYVWVPGATIFRAARVWVGVAASPVLDGFVLVDGDRNDAVGRWWDIAD